MSGLFEGIEILAVEEDGMGKPSLLEGLFQDLDRTALCKPRWQ